MTTQLERIKNELLLAGYHCQPVSEIKSDDDYAQSVGTCAWEICKKFNEYEHSGMSAGFAIQLITTLLNGGILSPLTNNPDEWICCSETYGVSSGNIYQSKRKFSCFSDDGLKTYYDIDEDCNRNWELDSAGNRTGWSSTKPKEDLVYHELEECKSGT